MTIAQKMLLQELECEEAFAEEVRELEQIYLQLEEDYCDSCGEYHTITQEC